MVRRRQAISHGRSHCGPRYLPPYGILRPLCVNLFAMYFKKCEIPFQSLFKIHLKPFPVKCKDLFIIRNHNRGRWWPGDGNSQCVSYHGTELGCPKYSGGLGSLGGSWTHTGPTGQKCLHVRQGNYELNSFGRRNTTAKNKRKINVSHWPRTHDQTTSHDRRRVSNHQPGDFFSNYLFMLTPKETSTVHMTSLVWEESFGDQWIPPQITSNAEKFSIWWRHHGDSQNDLLACLCIEVLAKRAVIWLTTNTCACKVIPQLLWNTPQRLYFVDALAIAFVRDVNVAGRVALVLLKVE